jgi:hypothetical protein
MSVAWEIAMRSKRVQGSLGSTVVEQPEDEPICLAGFATALISSLDTRECDRQTAVIPPSKFCCLKSADAHPCR